MGENRPAIGILEDTGRPGPRAFEVTIRGQVASRSGGRGVADGPEGLAAGTGADRLAGDRQRPLFSTETRPFQIPLGALLPIRVENLLPACKNLGVTHITNGAYRLHPVEWNTGEAAGMIASSK